MFHGHHRYDVSGECVGFRWSNYKALTYIEGPDHPCTLSSPSGQKRFMHLLQGADNSAPTISHLCEFFCTFKLNFRKISEIVPYPPLYKILFHGLQKSQDRRLAEIRFKNKKSLPFEDPFLHSAKGLGVISDNHTA